MKREYPTRPIVAVAAVVFNSKDQVLLVRRGREPGKGTWGIPGGALELGESLKSAVKRELIEETGIAVDPIELITIVERVIPEEEDRIRFHYVIVEYLCWAANNTTPKAADDVDRAVWAGIEEAKAFSVPAITLEVINRGWAMLKSGEQTAIP